MRRDDRDPFVSLDGDALPLDPELEALDAELARAGAIARARTFDDRPDPRFAGALRNRLVAALPTPVHAPLTAIASDGDASAAWAPARVDARISARTPIGETARPQRGARARWFLLVAAAALVAISVVAASGGLRLDRILPPPATSPTPLSSTAPTPTSPLSAIVAPSAAVSPEPNPDPSGSIGPDPTVSTPATAAASPTPKPSVKPSLTPARTAAPTPASMSLVANACPGGVVLDWSKPAVAGLDHYAVFRAAGGSVAAAYPPDAAIAVDSASSWDPTATDGFDADLGAGSGATYRAFALDASEAVLAVSSLASTTGLAVTDLGALAVDTSVPGSLTASWIAPGVASSCFTWGKLVVSATDPDPSYLKGATYLAVIGDPATTSVTVGEPAAKTFWMRYEVIRATSLGKFVVARTSVIQVSTPAPTP